MREMGVAHIRDAIAAAGMVSEFKVATEIAHANDLHMICVRCANRAGSELWQDQWRVCIGCKLILRSRDFVWNRNPHGEISL